MMHQERDCGPGMSFEEKKPVSKVISLAVLAVHAFDPLLSCPIMILDIHGFSDMVPKQHERIAAAYQRIKF